MDLVLILPVAIRGGEGDLRKDARVVPCIVEVGKDDAKVRKVGRAKV